MTFVGGGIISEQFLDASGNTDLLNNVDFCGSVPSIDLLSIILLVSDDSGKDENEVCNADFLGTSSLREVSEEGK